MTEFYLPDLGEGLQGAEIVEWQVQAGEHVKVDQLLVIVETAKAVVEIPSPVDATIVELLYQPGDTVAVGSALMTYQACTEANHKDVKSETNSKAFEQSLHAKVLEPEVKRESVSVVGELETRVEQSTVDFETLYEPESMVSQETARSDLAALRVPAQVQAYAEKLGLAEQLEGLAFGTVNETELLHLYESSRKQGEALSNNKDQIIPLQGARKVMAQTMSKSHAHIPAVTLFDDANISSWDQEDITTRVIAAVLEACREVPLLNSWYDEDNMCIQQFEDVHLGVAVNAESGLFVPVIRKAQSLSMSRIREILNRHIEQVKDRSIKPQKLLGATITLSNFGTLSGRYATPIIVTPQVAIVGIGKIYQQAMVVDGDIGVAELMPVSLSFDHRAASGAEAAQFMRALISSLESS